MQQLNKVGSTPDKAETCARAWARLGGGSLGKAWASMEYVRVGMHDLTLSAKARRVERSSSLISVAVGENVNQRPGWSRMSRMHQYQRGPARNARPMHPKLKVHLGAYPHPHLQNY